MLPYPLGWSRSRWCTILSLLVLSEQRIGAFKVLWPGCWECPSLSSVSEDAAESWAAGVGSAGSAGGAAGYEAAERERKERGAGATRPGGARPADPWGPAGRRVCQTAYSETAGEGQYPEALRSKAQRLIIKTMVTGWYTKQNPVSWGWSADSLWGLCCMQMSFLTGCFVRWHGLMQIKFKGSVARLLFSPNILVKLTNIRFWQGTEVCFHVKAGFCTVHTSVSTVWTLYMNEPFHSCMCLCLSSFCQESEKILNIFHV